MDNPMVISDTRSIANLGHGESVLGQTQLSIPIGGRIRSGIMVLTKAAQSNQKAVHIYNVGVERGAPFKDIGQHIMKTCNLSRSPLTPRNVPYFTVRKADFKNPNAAKEIMELYATDGDEGRQLYRFPIIFALDNWQANMPHDFRCYSANELKFWSQYDKQGRRFCLTHGDLGFIGEGNKKRAKRGASGRPIELRDNESEGICNPDECPEYQDRSCTITGRFIFYVPGISGSSAFELPTRSFYSLQNARQQMEMVAYLTGGKISGTYHGKPIFWIGKKNESVSMIDPATGKPKRVKQWLITLEADINIQTFFEYQESANRLAAAGQAAGALEYTGNDQDIDYEFDDIDVADDPPEEVSAPEQVEEVTNLPEAEANPADTYAHIEAKINAALNIDQINDVLDLLRDENELDPESITALRKRAKDRVKDLAKG